QGAGGTRGGTRGGRGGRLSDARDPGGNDFFAQRVTDDPQPSSDFYDPHQDQQTVLTSNEQHTSAPGHEAGAPAPWQQPPQTSISDRHPRRAGFQALPEPNEERADLPQKGQNGPDTQRPKDPRTPRDPNAPKIDEGPLLEGPRGNVIVEPLNE